MAVHSLHTISAAVTGTSYLYPGGTNYSYDFESGQGGWSGVSSNLNRTGGAHSGSFVLTSHVASAGVDSDVTYTLSGLYPTKVYTFTAWSSFDAATKIGVSGIGMNTGNAGDPAEPWVQQTYTFTATATSHTLILRVLGAASTGDICWWDDVKVTRATDTVGGPIALDVKSASITLDDSWNRYVQGSLVINPPDPTTFEFLNPLASPLRVSITGTVTYGSGTEWNTVARSDVTRTFDLVLLGRVKDEVNGEVTLTVESDEALLAAWTKITTTAERTYTRSVQDAVTYALGKIGATLQAGAADATLTPSSSASPITNYFINPSIETTTSGFTASTGTPTLTIDTAQHRNGTQALKGVSTVTSTDVAVSYAQTGLTVGTVYTLSWNVYTSDARTLVYCDLGAGAVQLSGSYSLSTAASLAATTWTRLSVTFTATTATPTFIFHNAGGPSASAKSVWMDNFMLTVGSTLYTYFDGDTTGTHDGYYWDGEPHISTSEWIANEPVAENLVFYNPTSGDGTANGATTDSSGTGSISHLAVSIPGVDHQQSAWRSTPANASVGGFWYTGGTAGSTTPVHTSLPHITPGVQYTLGLWVRCSIAKSVTLAITPYTSANSALTNITSSAVALAANTWTRITLTFTAPATANHFYFFSYESSAAWNGTATYDVAGASVVAGASDLGYFDGQTTDTNTYLYGWTGTPNNSRSIRTGAHLNSATVWLPGVSALDYVAPLVQAGALRLFCDEQRRWFLVDPTTYAVAGTVTLSPDTGITSATDTMSVEDSTDAATAVVVQYNPPTDPTTGLTPAPVYDIAGVQGVTKTIVHDQTQYPGPGAAAAVLNRAAGKGRTFSVSAETQLPATPGMSLSISVPDDTAQLGVVSSVTWHWPEAQMDVGSKGLTNTASNAWVLASGAWSAATGTWSGATGTN